MGETNPKKPRSQKSFEKFLGKMETASVPQTAPTQLLDYARRLCRGVKNPGRAVYAALHTSRDRIMRVDPIIDERWQLVSLHARDAARDMDQYSYLELVDVMRRYGGDLAPDALAARHLATLRIGEAVEAARVRDAMAEDLDCLREIVRNSVPPLDGPLFERASSFLHSNGRAVAILCRPADGERPRRQAMDLARERVLAVWVQPSRLCSWHPGVTRSYLIMRSTHPGIGIGFEPLAMP